MFLNYPSDLGVGHGGERGLDAGHGGVDGQEGGHAEVHPGRGLDNVMTTSPGILIIISPTCDQSRTKTRRRSRSSWWAGRSWWCRRISPGKTASQPNKHCIPHLMHYDCLGPIIKRIIFFMSSSNPINNKEVVCVCQKHQPEDSCILLWMWLRHNTESGWWHKYSQLVLCNLATKNMFMAVICGSSLIPCTW